MPQTREESMMIEFQKKILARPEGEIRVRRTGIGFKIMILGRLEGGRRTRRTLTTDNAAKIFILKPIVRRRGFRPITQPKIFFWKSMRKVFFYQQHAAYTTRQPVRQQYPNRARQLCVLHFLPSFFSFPDP